jgi:hypothetical protein
MREHKLRVRFGLIIFCLVCKVFFLPPGRNNAEVAWRMYATIMKDKFCEVTVAFVSLLHVLLIKTDPWTMAQTHKCKQTNINKILRIHMKLKPSGTSPLRCSTGHPKVIHRHIVDSANGALPFVVALLEVRDNLWKGIFSCSLCCKR